MDQGLVEGGGWSSVRKACARGDKEVSVKEKQQTVLWRLGRGSLLEKTLAFPGRRSSRCRRLNVTK